MVNSGQARHRAPQKVKLTLRTSGDPVHYERSQVWHVWLCSQLVLEVLALSPVDSLNPCPAAYTNTELKGPFIFHIYQCEQGHGLAWIIVVAWATQRQGNLEHQMWGSSQTLGNTAGQRTHDL